MTKQQRDIVRYIQRTAKYALRDLKLHAPNTDLQLQAALKSLAAIQHEATTVLALDLSDVD